MAITNYALTMDKAFAGALYDLSSHTVDSFAVEEADGIGAACAVIRGTDAEHQVKSPSASGDGAKVIGVTLHTHIEPPEAGKKYYPQNYTVPVVTKGRVWVTTGGAVNAGDEAHLKLADMNDFAYKLYLRIFVYGQFEVVTILFFFYLKSDIVCSI